MTNLQNKNKFLTISIALLGLVITIQSIYIYNLLRRQAMDKTSSKSIDTQLFPTENHKPGAHAQKDQRFDSFFDSDFDLFNPLQEMKRMRERMNHMFQNSLSRFRQDPAFRRNEPDIFSPDLDIQEKGKKYIIRLDLPGLDKSKINITLQDRILTISGIRKEEHEEKNSNQMLRQERYYGKFNRSITLPGPVDENKMEAKYEEGVLTITVPKADQKITEKQVKII